MKKELTLTFRAPNQHGEMTTYRVDYLLEGGHLELDDVRHCFGSSNPPVTAKELLTNPALSTAIDNLDAALRALGDWASVERIAYHSQDPDEGPDDR